MYKNKNKENQNIQKANGDIINWVEWLWNPSDSFVIFFFVGLKVLNVEKHSFHDCIDQ